MMLGPVMRCEGLKIQEKCLLSCVMSLKNSLDGVYTTDEKIMGLTGLSFKEFNAAYEGLTEKELLSKRGREWVLSCRNINDFLGAVVYPRAERHQEREVLSRERKVTNDLV